MKGILHFAKFHGLGNDFLLVDNTRHEAPLVTCSAAAQLCDRNFGVGADGVIFAMVGQHDCAYTMRIFNSDGTEPQMCGNGIRCLAKFVHQVIEQREPSHEVSYKIWTKAGVISPFVKADGSVTVDMGEPVLVPALVPTTLPGNMDYSVPNVAEAKGPVTVTVAVDQEVTLLNGVQIHLTVVGMGNPHAVSYFDCSAAWTTFSAEFATAVVWILSIFTGSSLRHYRCRSLTVWRGCSHHLRLSGQLWRDVLRCFRSVSTRNS
jgi:diaminopimelate epimerase